MAASREIHPSLLEGDYLAISGVRPQQRPGRLAGTAAATAFVAIAIVTVVWSNVHRTAAPPPEARTSGARPGSADSAVSDGGRSPDPARQQPAAAQPLEDGVRGSVLRAFAVSDATNTGPLFCFSLMVPNFYEISLITWQYQHNASIFACDAHAVYSNVTKELAPGLTTLPVASNLVCSSGGEFHTALNTDIFMAVWARVLSDGTFAYHDWTVKVDPDAVFLPVRLRAILRRHGEQPRGVYLNNCKLGMHGPLEVFSRQAVRTWWGGQASCQQHFNQVCSGPCLWGEDMFLDQCMEKVLRIPRVDEFQLLVEDHCEPPPNWMSCQAGDVAAIHPFKTVERYSACLTSTACAASTLSSPAAAGCRAR